ncbi:hypothetical protein D7V92_08715 [Parabacteroides sp. CH2-D42-20]|uniref:outer membrane protein assembly factor BamB family protein n=1 Tax=Parabacteroides sp. CH2-D42-20 TaxID=2320086 RepID=UPI000EF64B57|nr:PQQ-binding-like beta-propeller repeat protein [Parabacteroides sp. CH2-D42-20]RLT70000.1 hypothetical protein D7V92_08715 [Parabacteroides sp. CH2-D42-20]
MRVIKIFLLFVCCISLDVQSQTFLSDTLGINEDGSVIIAKSLALPGWILGVDVDSTDNLLFIRYRNLSKNETSLKNKGGISVYSLADQRMLWQRPVNYFNQDPKLTSEGVLFVTMGKATSLLDLKTGNEVWKKKKMIPYWVDAKNRMFLAYKGSYMNGVSNELEGHSLATGEKMWSRKMSHVYGWNESGLLDDSTRLIVSDGIHLVHMGNGEGPSYAMPTGASDYKEAVALGALGVVTGVLTGFAAVPTGPKKVMELVSNVLLDDTVFYVASRENLFCLDRQLQPKWGYPIPDGMGSRSHLFARGDSLYMINMGTGYRNTIFDTSEAYAHEYLRLKVGWPFIACFDKRKGEKVWFRQLSDKKEMVEEFDINWEEDALMVLFSDRIRKYSLSADSLLSEVLWNTEVNGKLLYLTNSSYFLQDFGDSTSYQRYKRPDSIYCLITDKNEMVELDQQLNVLQTYPLSKLRTFKALPNGDNLIFLGDKTLWVNSKGEKKAYLYTSSKMFRVGEKFFIYSLDGKKIYEFPL